MKIILFLVAIIAFNVASAQTLMEPFRGAEPFRTPITPFGRVVDAAKEDASASNYVAKLSEWNVSNDGKEYNSSFAVPVWWLNRQVLVRVGYSTSSYELLIDGRQVGFAASGATPVEFNITKWAKEGRHTLTVRHTESEQNSVSSTFSTQKPLVSDVAVICQPTIRVRDILCYTTINDFGEGVAEFSVVVKCDALNPKRARIGYTIRLDDANVLAHGTKDIELDMRREDTVRFMARVPKSALWSMDRPNMITLELENKVDNRPAEYIYRKIGVRSADVEFQTMYINSQPTLLRFVNYDSSKPIKEQLGKEYNGLVLPVQYATESVLSECDKLGVLVFIQSAIHTTFLANHIRIGGNPSNNPFWLESYLSLNRAAYYTTSIHPCVVGYAIADGDTTGINIYESYLLLKRLEMRLPIVYEGANGEWCTDLIEFR